ncbi:DNA-dependent metalloprotease Wss1p [Trichomonascus vanleenenianus]|uniref:DNA-dependent metalloprotease Wss1p n=1 Tax=Trichomonascus vanleenenianus TaxID=2268995 RepID=UPI003ECA8418
MVIRGSTRRAAQRPKESANLPKSSSEFVREITSLKRKPERDHALYLLHRAASLVKPIMKKRSLKVGVLCEMFPKSPNLLGLNVNRGAKVCIRLRPPHNERVFYPMEEIVGTLLHELTHNLFGPHDAKFFKYLDELKAEFEELVVSGYTGDGFFSQGQILGRRPGSLLPNTAEDRKRLAAEAAAKRAGLFAGSGQKLGGGPKDTHKSVQDMVREAALRRADASKWCASDIINGESAIEIIESLDLTGDSDDERVPSPSATPSNSTGASRDDPIVLD